VTKIKELEGRVVLKNVLHASSSIDINDVSVHIEFLNALVVSESLLESKDTRNTDFAAANIKSLD